MSIDAIKVGASLYFNGPLQKAAGVLPTRLERNESHNVNGHIIPTPPDVWGKLQKALGLSDRADNMESSALNAAYVPYKDGNMNFYEGVSTVISGEFSGCLMACYTVDNQRRIAHVPTAGIGGSDCKAAFRDMIEKNENYEFVQFFRPFTDKVDGDRQYDWIRKLMKAQIITEPYGLNAMGITCASGDKCYSVLVAVSGSGEDTLYHVLERKTHKPTKDLKEFAGLKTRSVLT